ncbi:MAG: HEAT repeat domain-containing protein [Elusimicrobiota bacterium]
MPRPRASLASTLAMVLASALTAASGTAAESPPSAQDLMGEMERLHSARRSEHPLDARELDKRLAAFGVRFRKLGSDAVPLLGWYAGRRERPLKLRLYAAAFLGLIGDPGALRPLTSLVRDPDEDPGLRSAALQSVGSLRLSEADLRPILDEAAHPSNPPAVVREALAQLAWTGTVEVGRISRIAKRNGPDPQGLDRGAAAHAAAALGRSPSPKADAALFDLLRHFKKGSPLRPRALAALERRHLVAGPGGGVSRGRRLTRRDMRTLTSLLAEEEGETALMIARLLGGVGDRRATPALARSLRTSQDPAFLAEAAQALAAIGDPAASEALARLNDGLIRDPRFRPRPAAPDPRPHASRIEKAAALFARAAEPPPAPEEEAPPAARPAEDEAAAPAKAPGAKPPPAPAEDRRAHAPLPPRETPAGGEAARFRYEGWPGEGKPNLRWNGSVASLLLRTAPGRASPGAGSAALKSGESIPFQESAVLTITPGRARARREVVLDAREMGPVERLSREGYAGAAVRRRLRLREGRMLELLSYRAEGLCFVRHEGTVYEAPCPHNDREHFEIIEEPDVEWWLRAEVSGLSGWFPAEQEGIDFLTREF